VTGEFVNTKIFAVGCLHGELKESITDFIKSEKPDLILISGDFSGGDYADKLRKYEKKLVEDFGPIPDFWPLKVQIESDKNFLKWSRISAKNTEKIFQVLKKIDIPIFFIHGNWDSIALDEGKSGLKKFIAESSGDFLIDKAADGNLKFIHNKLVRIKGLNIIGYGGYRGTSLKEYLHRDLPAPRMSMKYILEIRRQMEKEMEKLFMQAKSGKTILLTHDPPYKVLDYLASAKKNYGEKITRDVIRKNSPMLCICSHFHEHQGVEKIKDTTVVNTGYGREGQCALIEIDGDVKVKLLKL
jgi:Icc-related predicted phosphoesterase